MDGVNGEMQQGYNYGQLENVYSPENNKIILEEHIEEECMSEDKSDKSDEDGDGKIMVNR